METEKKQYRLIPTFGDSLGTGWNVMFDNFLRLFLIVIIMGISIIISIFYTLINNIALTLKFYNIKNLREGSAILDKLEKVSESPNE